MNNEIKYPKNIINLVSGGAGFLGSHLIDILIKRNEKVISLDNYLSGQISNIEKWLNHPNFEIIKHDVTEPINLDRKIHKIWHLASPASPIYYKSNPIKTSKIIFLGTYNMLELARKNSAILLFASTSEIYGDPEVDPQPESYGGNVNPIGIRSW